MLKLNKKMATLEAEPLPPDLDPPNSQLSLVESNTTKDIPELLKGLHLIGEDCQCYIEAGRLIFKRLSDDEFIDLENILDEFSDEVLPIQQGLEEHFLFLNRQPEGIYDAELRRIDPPNVKTGKQDHVRVNGRLEGLALSSLAAYLKVLEQPG